MKKYVWLLLVSFNVQAMEICGSLEQAGLLVIDGKELIAFDRDADLNQVIKNQPITLKKMEWDIQNITGVPQKTVTPSKADVKAISQEATRVKKGYAKVVDYPYWKNGFDLPLSGRISGKYGGQRIYNGTPKSPHLGVDIARPTGTSVKASGDGVVVLTSFNGFYNGNLIIINHGSGLKTLYAHLSKINVKEGDEVKKGQEIGLVGTTGRSTGPHLHFGANLNGIKFNPDTLYKINSCLRDAHL